MKNNEEALKALEYIKTCLKSVFTELNSEIENKFKTIEDALNENNN